ncbi:MBL fold metallo-hydrolase [Microbulbifer sp. CnH-101-G]|uniref:MBL fold metallo-hydrolase n=1 Tax=Microbulbifer sp. CnH-101-G TaxID=3243393 RepID=UPI00403A0A19
MKNKLYLKPNVQIEPLINNWHAHLYLMAPLSASCFLQKQLNIMRSFVKMPQAHLAALQNPNMIGGEFIDYPLEKVSDIELLISNITSDNFELISLYESLSDLIKRISTKQDKKGLEELYLEIPELLKGFIELTYDIHHQLSFRPLEPLLYSSDFYKLNTQKLCLSNVTSEERAFIFGTPRIQMSDNLILDVPLNDYRVDYISKLRYIPADINEIVKTLCLSEDKLDKFMGFLTEKCPRRPDEFTGKGVRIRYFGHACVLVESMDTSILIDPLVCYEYDDSGTRFSFADLPNEIDYVVITHGHHDHFVVEQLIQLRHKIKNIIVPASNGSLQDPSLKHACSVLGFKNVYSLEELDHIDIPSGRITAMPFFGEHCDLDIKGKLTYHLSLKDHSMVFIADSNNLSPKSYKIVANKLGPVDIVFISQECTGAPMSWAYGALFVDGLDREISRSRRSYGPDSNAAFNIVEAFSANQVYLYAMGAERWLNYLMALKESHAENTRNEIDKVLTVSKEKNITAEMLYERKEIILE